MAGGRSPSACLTAATGRERSFIFMESPGPSQRSAQKRRTVRECISSGGQKGVNHQRTRKAVPGVKPALFYVVLMESSAGEGDEGL